MTRILHLSDPHFGAADPAVANRFLEQTKAMFPDLTVLSGDLTMRARRSEMIDAREFVRHLPTPRLVIPGNHDLPAFNQIYERFANPFRRFRHTFGPDIEPIHSSAGLHAVSVNSCKPWGPYLDWSAGRITQRELARTDQRLAGPPGVFRVLVLHHPLIAPDGFKRDVVRPLDALLNVTAKRRVDLVLCGHFHCSHTAVLGPPGGWQTLVSQAGTVCSTRLQGEPQGFHLIRLAEDGIEIDRHELRDGTFSHEGTLFFRRHEDGWRAAPVVEPGFIAEEPPRPTC